MCCVKTEKKVLNLKLNQIYLLGSEKRVGELEDLFQGGIISELTPIP